MIRPWRALVKNDYSALTRSTQAGVGSSQYNRDLLQSQHGNTPNADRPRIMWVDGVGGYLLLDANEFTIGQAVASATVDIPIVGDLSRMACAMHRSESDYVLHPLQDVHIDAQHVQRPQVVSNGSTIQLGSSVKLRFVQPSPLSASARLELVSRHRFKPHVDAVLLLADSAILGPSQQGHVYCPAWPNQMVMFRDGADWYFRVFEAVEVNGKTSTEELILVQSNMRIAGESFSLSIE